MHLPISMLSSVFVVLFLKSQVVFHQNFPRFDGFDDIDAL